MESKIKLTKQAKIKKAKRICWLYSQGQHTIASCCEAEGITYSTFQGWVQSNLSDEDVINGRYRRGFVHEVHVLYKKTLEDNNINYKALLKDATREGLLTKARGIMHTETHIKVQYDLRGNAIGTVIRKIEKYLPPDTTILIFLANCLRIFEDKTDSGDDLTNSLANSFTLLTIDQIRAKRLELENELSDCNF